MTIENFNEVNMLKQIIESSHDLILLNEFCNNDPKLIEFICKLEKLGLV